MKRNYWKRGRWLWEIDLKLTNITDFNLMIHEFKINEVTEGENKSYNHTGDSTFLIHSF